MTAQTTEFWFAWYPALYRQKTLHLTAEQDGVYRRLIDYYMESAQPLPDNINAIARIAGVACDSDSIAIALLFFSHKPGIGYRHKTCDSILSEMYQKHVKRKGAGIAGANARWKNIDKIQDSEWQSHSNAIAKHATPTPTPTEEVSKKDIATKVALSDSRFSSLFEMWWSIYPKQRAGAKAKAKESYKRAISRSSAEEIYNGTASYAQSDEVRRGFAKGAAAWLNDDRWANDYKTLHQQAKANAPLSFAERDRLAQDEVKQQLMREYNGK